MRRCVEPERSVALGDELGRHARVAECSNAGWWTRDLQSVPFDDHQYKKFVTGLHSLGAARDTLAGQIKRSLWNAEFSGAHLVNAWSQLGQCYGLLGRANDLAEGGD